MNRYSAFALFYVGTRTRVPAEKGTMKIYRDCTVYIDASTLSCWTMIVGFSNKEEC